jgi:hypothetical protein
MVSAAQPLTGRGWQGASGGRSRSTTTGAARRKCGAKTMICPIFTFGSERYCRSRVREGIICKKGDLGGFSGGRWAEKDEKEGVFKMKD